MKKIFLTFSLILIFGSNISFQDTGLGIENVFAANYDTKNAFPGWQEGTEETALIVKEGKEGKKGGEVKTLTYFIPRIIDLMIKFVAPILLLYIIYAGVNLVWAGDDEAEIENTKKFFVWAIIGFFFIVSAYSLVKFSYFIIL